MEKVIQKLKTLAKNLDTPSPCNGRAVAQVCRELVDELKAPPHDPDTAKRLSTLTTPELTDALDATGYGCDFVTSSFSHWSASGDAVYAVVFDGGEGLEIGFVFISLENGQLRGEF
jgi:hypothetical protein